MDHLKKWSFENSLSVRSNLVVALALSLDHFMNIWYEVIVYGINLFIVFVTPDPIDMVLNSLALEVILQLDDVVKEKYISIVVQDEKKNFFPYAMDRESIIEKYHEQFHLTSDATTPAMLHNALRPYKFGALHVVYEVWHSYVFPILVFTLPPLTLIYLSYCKPGNLSDSPAL